MPGLNFVGLNRRRAGLNHHLSFDNLGGALVIIGFNKLVVDVGYALDGLERIKSNNRSKYFLRISYSSPITK